MAEQNLPLSFGPAFSEILSSEIIPAFAKKVVDGVKEKTGKSLTALGESFTKDITGKVGFQRAHHEIAVTMQQSVLSLYDSRVEGRKTMPSYRIGKNRLSGGLLRNVLESAEMIEATPKTVSYGNLNLLDSTARQWRRLNYGAGDQKGLGKALFVTYQGANLRLEDKTGPSPAFQMPIGVWRTQNLETFRARKVKGRGKEVFAGTLHSEAGFFPLSKTQLRPEFSKIEGRQFFEGAMYGMKVQLPESYDALVVRMYVNAKKAGQAAAQG